MNQASAAFRCSALPFYVIVAMVTLSVSPLYAVNTGFLPGDCCFHFELTRELVRELTGTGTEPVRLRYKRPEWVPSTFCGYAGYWQINGRDLKPELKEGLRDAYRRAREYSPLNLTINVDEKTGVETPKETNPLSVLIYNDNFDFQKYELFIKYNENWPKESVVWGLNGWGDAKGGGVPVGRYFPFRNDHESMMKEWYRGADVPQLNAELPVPLNDTVGEYCGKFVSFKQPIKLVVTPHKVADFSKPSEGMVVVVVTEKGLETFEFHPKEGWQKPTSKEDVSK